MAIIQEQHLCPSCGQTFRSIESITFHKNICIYYQYRTIYQMDSVSNETIKSIVNIYNLLELYKLNDINDNYDNVLIKNILNKLYPKLRLCELNKTLYDRVIDIQGDVATYKLEFISYNELLSIISNLLNTTTNTFCNVINTFNTCCNHFK